MKNFSGSLIWLTLSEVVFNLAAYVVHAVVGRILGPADYGRYGIVVTLTTMIIVLVGNGIPTAMSKYLSEVFESHPEQIPSLKQRALLLQSILIGSLTLIFFLLAPVIAWALHDSSLTSLFRLSSLVIPAFAAASFYHYYLTGLHLFKLQAIVKIIRSFARVGFIACAAIFLGLPGAIGGYILAPFFTFGAVLLIDLFYIQPKLGYGKKVDTSVPRFPYKKLLTYAGPLTLFLIFYELILTLDLYFVKSLLGDDHLTGLYNAAITVGRIPYYLFAALAMLLLPAISKSTAELDHAATESLVTRSLRLLTLLLFPLITLLVTYASEILHFFYGTRYNGAENTLKVFAIGVGFLTVFYVLAFALNGAGQVKTPMWLSFFGCLALIPLNLVLIPIWGIVGAALATTLTTFVLTIAILIYTKRHFNVHASWKALLFSLLTAFIIVFLSRFLPHGHLGFIFSGLFLFVLYFGLLRLFGELRDSDLVPFKKLFIKKA